MADNSKAPAVPATWNRAVTCVVAAEITAPGMDVSSVVRLNAAAGLARPNSNVRAYMDTVSRQIASTAETTTVHKARAAAADIRPVYRKPTPIAGVTIAAPAKSAPVAIVVSRSARLIAAREKDTATTERSALATASAVWPKMPLIAVHSAAGPGRNAAAEPGVLPGQTWIAAAANPVRPGMSASRVVLNA